MISSLMPIVACVLFFALFVLEENVFNAGGPKALSLDRKPHGSAEGMMLLFELAVKFRARNRLMALHGQVG